MIRGILIGAALYAVTAFPFALVTQPGDGWAAAFMLYGVICGAIGFLIADERWS